MDFQPSPSHSADNPVEKLHGSIVRHVLQEWSGEGHCAAIRSNLCEMAAKLLEIPLPIIDQAIAAELTEGNLIAEMDGSDEFIFLTPLHRAEIGCAANLNRLNQGDAPWGLIDVDKAIPWVEEQTGMTLSQSQATAVRLVLQHKVSVITGGPGVGKTTLVMPNNRTEILICLLPS